MNFTDVFEELSKLYEENAVSENFDNASDAADFSKNTRDYFNKAATELGLTNFNLKRTGVGKDSEVVITANKDGKKLSAVEPNEMVTHSIKNAAEAKEYLGLMIPELVESCSMTEGADNEEVEIVDDNMPAEEVMPPVLQAVKEMLDSYLANPMVDKSRVYIMGLSMGGMGTYDLVSRFPETFAAAIPICGAVKAGRLAAAKKVKFRIFHGDADNVVPVECSRAAYRELKKAGADVEYIEFPGCNHGSWNPAFNMPDFMKWLFKNKKK
jgi:dienelactone hydrolase